MLCDLQMGRGDHYTNPSFISLCSSLGQTNSSLYQESPSHFKSATPPEPRQPPFVLRGGGRPENKSVQEAAWKAIMVPQLRGERRVGTRGGGIDESRILIQNRLFPFALLHYPPTLKNKPAVDFWNTSGQTETQNDDNCWLNHHTLLSLKPKGSKLSWAPVKTSRHGRNDHTPAEDDTWIDLERQTARVCGWCMFV